MAKRPPTPTHNPSSPSSPPHSTSRRSKGINSIAPKLITRVGLTAGEVDSARGKSSRTSARPGESLGGGATGNEARLARRPRRRNNRTLHRTPARPSRGLHERGRGSDRALDRAGDRRRGAGGCLGGGHGYGGVGVGCADDGADDGGGCDQGCRLGDG